MINMKITTIFNRKGGVGKTFLTNAIGSYLANSGTPTLLIDLDPQASLSEYFKRVHGIQKSSLNALHICGGDVTDDSAIIQVRENLFIIQADKYLSGAETTCDLNVLSEYLPQFEDRFKHVIMDGAGNWSPLIHSAIIASHQLIVPVFLRADELDNALFSIERGLAHEHLVSKILINCYTGSKTELEILEAYKPDIQDHLFNTKIPDAKDTVTRYGASAEQITQSKKKAILHNAIQDLVHETFEAKAFAEAF